MAVKRKRQEVTNERHLRSGRTVKATSAVLSSSSNPHSPRKAIPQEPVDGDIAIIELKLSKAGGPSSPSTHDNAESEYETHSVVHHRTPALDTAIISPRTSKRKQASSKHPSVKSVSHSQGYSPHENMPDSNAFLTQLPLFLSAQKREILRSLQNSSFLHLDVPSTQETARKHLSEIVQGSMIRGEGNSCIVLGPRGSGKTRTVESCVQNLAIKPIILRLNGWVQTTDKQALREIATQLLHQTGSHFVSDAERPDPTFDDDDDSNPFLEEPQINQDTQARQSVRLPPSSQLHALIPVLLTLKRPVIVILDAFDLFALHPRQSLLYCLLDNVQSCRSTPGNQGIAVIGITSRFDTIQLLEKRVKSRFSGRIIRTAPPNDFEHWLSIAKNVLLVPIALQEEISYKEWREKWSSSVENFLSDSKVLGLFRESFEISKDAKVLIRLLTQGILQLRTNEPYLNFKMLFASVDPQRSRLRYHVNNLSYPMVCLIIASNQVEITGHSTFSFEMLFEKFRDQVRASTAAPVQLNGSHVGMVKCTREVLLVAFDDLVSSRVFVPSVGYSTLLSKEFAKHRCGLDRETIKRIVEKSGQIHLKKWFNKG